MDGGAAARRPALATELGFRLISNQPQYSALWRVIEEEVVPASQELGISQIVWSPIAQGVLTGKYKPGPRCRREPGDRREGRRRAVRQPLPQRRPARPGAGLEPIAAELDLSPAQLAVAWVLQNPNVASAIIGASRPEQVRRTCAPSGVTIPLPLLERIDEVLGDSVERDPARTARNAPSRRLA